MTESINILYSKSELTDIIFSKSGIHLLKIFLFKPNVEMHQAEVIEKSKLSRMTVKRLISVYYKNHILNISKKGDLILYSIAENNPIVKQLKIFINISNIYESIKVLADKNIEVFLFGSAARGEDTEKSDIDILVISDLDKKIILNTIGAASYNLKREINPIIYTSIDFSKLPNTDKSFYEKFERDRIRLI